MINDLVNGYDIDPHFAEIYDQDETYSDDLGIILASTVKMHPHGQPSGPGNPILKIYP
jgi:hypothetical protein